MIPRPRLSIVIPALNEENGIQEVAERVLSIADRLSEVGFGDLELIVVDDGSTDRTAAIAGAMRGVRLVRHPHNRGYGAALKTGYAAATGEWIGFLDADGTYPPEYFPQLCKVALERNADIVIGSRMAGSASQMPVTRRIGNYLFAGLVSLIAGQRITDSASGMRVFRRSVLERIYPLPDGLNLTPVMSTRALHENLTIIEEPIPYAERVGRSKLNIVRDGWRFAQSIVWTALSYNPARLLGLVGLTALLLAAAIVLGLFAVRLSGVDTLSAAGAFMIFLGMVIGVVGISLLSLGISFNYFVALFHRQPVRQGVFGRPIFSFKLEHHFGWIGAGTLMVGILVGFGALGFALTGVPTDKLWLYYLGSAGMVLIGIQLIIAWVQMQVLEALSARDNLVQQDMQGAQVVDAEGSQLQRAYP
jgi:glycosyltransferase involved in cell wall biosynthesis